MQTSLYRLLAHLGERGVMVAERSARGIVLCCTPHVVPSFPDPSSSMCSMVPFTEFHCCKLDRSCQPSSICICHCGSL